MATGHKEAKAASAQAHEPQPESAQQSTPAEVNDQEMTDAAPASPPLPSKHTAVTPGPRAARFQEVFATSLKQTLEKINWVNFSACYPTIATHAPGTLQAVQQQMVRLLGEKSSREFDAVLQNRNVVAKVNELESLISDAARRRDESGGDAQRTPAPVPLHLLPADDILAAHLAPHLASQQSQLHARLQTMQAHNAELFDEIQAQRREIEALLGGVEKVLSDMDGANDLLEDVVEDLAKESRTAEVEMSGT
ncbi:Nnf1-domain-containing protein [Thozetella sp. PMI_491]|nr:Nnf1-domain-containing protein [Thozetella sp. PMI_491]